MSQAAERQRVEWVPREDGGKWTLAEAREMADAFQASGETLTAFGRRHGLSPERMRWWLKRLGVATVPKTATPPGRVTFAPVRLVSPAKGRRAPSARSDDERPGDVMEVVLRGGRRVRVGADFDARMLQRLVAALEEGVC